MMDDIAETTLVLVRLVGVLELLVRNMNQRAREGKVKMPLAAGRRSGHKDSQVFFG